MIEAKEKPFQRKEDLHKFICLNTPICVKPKKKAKTMFVGVFTSEHALDCVVDKLTDSIWEKLNS